MDVDRRMRVTISESELDELVEKKYIESEIVGGGVLKLCVAGESE